ncbi:hypothetical protein BGX31_002217 [Mortierella sp. GBA43]|nr:hypothetical protein BGX31_002217 [Mortierella sp. GBA43]
MYSAYAVVALIVHLYWFHKLVQLRHSRDQQPTTASTHVEVTSVVDEPKPVEQTAEAKPSEQPAESKPEEPLVLPVSSDIKDRKSTIVFECPPKATLPRAADIFSGTVASTEQPIIKNSMSEMDEAVMNGMQVNSSGRHRQCKVMRRRSRPSFDHLTGEDIKSDSAAPVPTAIDTTVSTSITGAPTVASPTSPTSPKTMKELLEECENEDFSSIGMAMHSVIKGSHNKTFSPQALKRMSTPSMSTNGTGQGAVVSRASSMRDSKRRIGLDAIRFEEPINRSSHKPQHSTPPPPVATALAQVQEHCTLDDSANATVVLRSRPSRLSVTRSSFVESNKGSHGRSSTLKSDHDFGTIRMVRGVAIQA